MRQSLFIIIILLFCQLIYSQNYFRKFKDLDKQRVSIVGDDFSVEADVIKPEEERKIKANDLRRYTWFVNNQIQNTQGGYDSKLMHGLYVAKYANKSLKEKGEYRYGLKKGVWKQWYENGDLKLVARWKKGDLYGKFIQFNNNNEIQKTGRYKKGNLHGAIINYNHGKATSVTYYKNGIVQESKVSKKESNTSKTALTKEKHSTKERFTLFWNDVKTFFTPKKKTNQKPKEKKGKTNP